MATDMSTVALNALIIGEAGATISFIEQHDPVLLTAIRNWGKEKKIGIFGADIFVAGALLCYKLIREKAEKAGEPVPSYTLSGKKPVLLSQREFHWTVDYLSAHDRNIMETTGRIAMGMDDLARAYPLLPRSGGTGALIATAVIYTYGAIRSISVPRRSAPRKKKR